MSSLDFLPGISVTLAFFQEDQDGLGMGHFVCKQGDKFTDLLKVKTERGALRDQAHYIF